ncbi:MAG: hypothetical protein IJE49_12520 [Agathobacter sp.]|nr:hypothetical protein [Agathobacter sp.]MBQ2902650.1 hypothetical protein [Agathobacter sp.]
MKIQNSSISMSSTHLAKSFQFMEHATIEGRASEDLEGVILSLSKEAEDGSYAKAIESYEQQQKEEAKQRQEQNLKSLAQVMQTKRKENYGFDVSDEYELKLELLRQMLEMLNKGKNLTKLPSGKLNRDGVLDLRSMSSSEGAVPATPRIGTTSGGTMWQKITVSSASITEYESTSFMTQGKVQTEDGRSIDFNVAFSMSRACSACINTMEVSNYILTDPLVINLNTEMTEISDQKFFFDIDSDGKEEEISELGKGSGFLALDKNEDGIINDGNELFGTQSGDGFKDLKAYDEDRNLWIDENDEIFHKLKVWMKDEEGNDILIDLKDADIGAIYLGNANTEYSFKDDSLNTNAVLRKTGVYLRESTGKVGTVSHVDLAV